MKFMNLLGFLACLFTLTACKWPWSGKAEEGKNQTVEGVAEKLEENVEEASESVKTDDTTV